MKETALITGVECPCGKQLRIQGLSPLRIKRTKYCSLACKYKYRIRPRGLTYNITSPNKAWFPVKTRKQIDYKGYVSVYVGNKRRKKEHRIVLEQYLGRELERTEVVHHLNGNKTDNRLKNLLLLTKQEHDAFHREKRRML